MRKSIIILIVGIVIFSGIAGAVLFSGIFWAKQEGNIILHGFNESYLQLSKWTDDYGGSYQPVCYLTPEGSEIPIPISELSVGQYTTKEYRIDNQESHSYIISFSVDTNWFNDTQNPYYGFTYGIFDYYSHQDLNDVSISIPGGNHCTFNIWYQVDSLMLTPPEGTVPVNITISAVAIQ